MGKLTELENLISDLHRVKSLMKILDTHFTSERSKEISLDWYSVTYLFNEYSDLSSVAIKVLNEAEKGLKNIVENYYKELRGN